MKTLELEHNQVRTNKKKGSKNKIQLILFEFHIKKTMPPNGRVLAFMMKFSMGNVFPCWVCEVYWTALEWLAAGKCIMKLNLTIGVLITQSGWSVWNQQGFGIANHRGRKAKSMAITWHSIHSPPLYPWEGLLLVTHMQYFHLLTVSQSS